MNYKAIRYILGCVLNCEAACMVLPLICAVFFRESVGWVFVICMALCALAGCSLTIKKPENKSIYAKEGFSIVALSWILMSLFGSLPFVISGYIPSFIDALFETVSGFTTTGASILTDVEALPKSLIFWRSFTHWIGGMGILVFLVAIVPLSGSNNLHLIKAESTGASVSKMVPKIKSMTKILYSIYIAFTVIEIILLLLGGMTPYEAITLSFGTAGTGGFGILNSSISSYSSYVQIVITIFMIIFGVDFSVYYCLIMRRFRDAAKSDEVKAYLGIIALSIILITINCRHLFASLFETVKHTAFQVGSIITTTGYMTTDFDLWPDFSKTILVILMFIGACAGSTGGGIKVSRILILVKSIAKEIKIAAHPKRTYKITLSGRVIEHETIRAINVFMVSFMVIYGLSLLIISMDNMGFTTNFTAVAATINNIGPGLDLVGPTKNFSEFSNLSKLVLTFDMLVGRLEIYPVLVLLSPYTWRK